MERQFHTPDSASITVVSVTVIFSTCSPGRLSLRASTTRSWRVRNGDRRRHSGCLALCLPPGIAPTAWGPPGAQQVGNKREVRWGQWHFWVSVHLLIGPPIDQSLSLTVNAASASSPDVSCPAAAGENKPLVRWEWTEGKMWSSDHMLQIHTTHLIIIHLQVTAFQILHEVALSLCCCSDILQRIHILPNFSCLLCYVSYYILH